MQIYKVHNLPTSSQHNYSGVYIQHKVSIVNNEKKNVYLTTRNINIKIINYVGIYLYVYLTFKL